MRMRNTSARACAPSGGPRPCLLHLHEEDERDRKGTKGTKRAKRARRAKRTNQAATLHPSVAGRLCVRVVGAPVAIGPWRVSKSWRGSQTRRGSTEIPTSWDPKPQCRGCCAAIVVSLNPWPMRPPAEEICLRPRDARIRWPLSLEPLKFVFTFLVSTKFWPTLL